jgi:hypothetical protein
MSIKAAWYSNQELQDVIQTYLEPSSYYQLTGLSGRICEYLSQPSLWLSKFDEDGQGNLHLIMTVALGIILSIPLVIGLISRSVIQFAVGEPIAKETYQTELNNWIEKKTFQQSIFGASYARFLDFCIRNRIQPEKCPFQCIGAYKNLGANGTVPYLFGNVDSFFFKVDEYPQANQGKNFLVIADITYAAGDIKDQFKKNNNKKNNNDQLPCGVAIIRDRVFGDEFSQRWIESAVHDITHGSIQE